jgi:hypothetical protein
MRDEPSDYERAALASIYAWKHPNIGWLDRVMEVIHWPLEKTGDLIAAVPGADWVIEHVIGGLVSVLNDLAHWTVRADMIYEEYHSAGFSHVHTASDIFSLDLEDADRVSDWLGAKL